MSNQYIVSSIPCIFVGTLSAQHQARLEIEGLIEGTDFSETLTRARFEELNLDLFKKTLGPVQKVITTTLTNYCYDVPCIIISPFMYVPSSLSLLSLLIFVFISC